MILSLGSPNKFYFCAAFVPGAQYLSTQCAFMNLFLTQGDQRLNIFVAVGMPLRITLEV